MLEVLAVTLTGSMAVTHHLYWSWKAAVVPFGDTAVHLYESAAIYQELGQPLPWTDKFLTVWTWRGMYPPLVYWVTALWDGAIGTRVAISVASLSVFILLLVVAAYLVGRHVGGPLAGMTAACLVVIDPALMATQVAYFLEPAVAAFCVLSLALLLKSREFERGWSSVALGVALGLGFLGKFSLVFFLIVPFAYIAASAALAQARSDRASVRRAMILILAGGVVFAGLLGHTVAAGAVRVSLGKTPGVDFSMISAWIAAVLGGLVVAERCLRGAMRNLCRCLGVFGVVAGPWVLANGFVLLNRTGEMQRHGLRELVGDLADLGAVLPWYDLLGALGALLCYLLSRRVREKLTPVYLALLGGGLLTFLAQPTYSLHYMVPLTAMASVLMGASLPRPRWVAVPVTIGVMAVAALILLWGPATMVFPEAMAQLTPRVEGWGILMHPARDAARPFDDRFGRKIVKRLPEGVSTVCCVGAPGTFQDAALYSVATASAWSGEIHEVWMALGDQGRPSFATRSILLPDAFATCRASSLGRRRGADPSRFRPPSADAVVVVGTTPAAAIVRRLFGLDYKEIASGTAHASLFVKTAKPATQAKESGRDGRV